MSWVIGFLNFTGVNIFKCLFGAWELLKLRELEEQAIETE